MPVLKIHAAVFSIQLKMHGDLWVMGKDEKCYSKNGPSEKQYKNMENMRNNGSSQKMKARSNHRSMLKIPDAIRVRGLSFIKTSQ